jgi:hypothetical protein
MKKKDIYELTIKVIGIIAAWKFVESIIASVVVYITFQCISGVSQTNFSVQYFVSIALYGLFGYLLLFHTGKILKLFRLTDPTEVTLQIGKKAIYHIVVLLIGFFMFIYSANQLVSSTFSKIEATATHQITEQTGIRQSSTEENVKTVVRTSSSPTSTTTTTINYVNVFLTLLSILMIIKSQKISCILMPKEEEELRSSPCNLQ